MITHSIYNTLFSPIESIDGIGSIRAKKLERLGFCYVGDLLCQMPKSWIDDRHITHIQTLTANQESRIQGVIQQRHRTGYGRKATVHITLSDAHGETIQLTFFHASYMMSDARLAEGKTITARGMPERRGHQWKMTHPDWSTPERFTAGWQPKYASIAGFPGKTIGDWIRKACHLVPPTSQSPLDLLLHNQPSLRQALCALHLNLQHHPESTPIQQAIQRLQLEELLVYLNIMQQQRKQAEVITQALAATPHEQDFIASLPFPLTSSQQHVWHEIGNDLASGKRMHRLLQGDVGAGKTWVAALGMVRCFAHDLQSAIMAPTEVLAIQHAHTLHELLEPHGIRVALITGSTKKRERKSILKSLADGTVHVLIGTHAILSDDVIFHKLRLAMIDEQHRFGVQQRWALSDKGDVVHLLAMTATPIPRSLALALYGDMQLSLMQGLPEGRKTIITKILQTTKMPDLANAVDRMLDQGGQVYWIVPRIDDDDQDYTSVEDRLITLQQRFPKANVLGLHGKMKAKDKQQALQTFADGSCRLLVSTTVIEVGVNVPEARVIVIEHADVYGLAQLHQLRGRVGRSSAQSYCMLIPSKASGEKARHRLALMTHCHHGLTLAESDLEQRGAGDAIGTRQSGEAGFRLIDPSLDAKLIQQWYNSDLIAQLNPIAEPMVKFWRPLAEAVD